MSDMSTKEIKPIHLYPYQFRVLERLYDRPYFIQELNKDAKLQHSPVAVQRMREKGINIVSEWKPNPLKTPSRRQVVEYHLHPESRDLAYKSLKAHSPKFKG